jgi:hypothetical protein
MTALRVLIACEFSGTVRNAFLALGHDAWSCDLLPAEDGSNRHITGDAREILNDGWDLLMVAHPPCTRLCNSGVRWLSTPPPGKTADQMQAELRDPEGRVAVQPQQIKTHQPHARHGRGHYRARVTSQLMVAA